VDSVIDADGCGASGTSEEPREVAGEGMEREEGLTKEEVEEREDMM
jgi:hypothetical protein